MLDSLYRRAQSRLHICPKRWSNVTLTWYNCYWLLRVNLSNSEIQGFSLPETSVIFTGRILIDIVSALEFATWSWDLLLKFFLFSQENTWWCATSFAFHKVQWIPWISAISHAAVSSKSFRLSRPHAQSRFWKNQESIKFFQSSGQASGKPNNPLENKASNPWLASSPAKNLTFSGLESLVQPKKLRV